VTDVLKAEAPTALAVADGRIAVADGRTVFLLSAGRGTVATRFDVDGVVRELALSPQCVAMLIGDRIELHDATNGSLLRRVQVAKAANLSIEGAAVVFTTGRVIQLLNIRTGRISVLARPRAYPTGVSVERRRVAWAEDTRSGSRIRMLRLPAGYR
jgi:hypothetical protein